MPRLIAEAAALNNAIITALTAAGKPMAAVDLYDNPTIHGLAANPDKVSRVCSNLFAGRHIGRVPYTHPTSTSVRFAYTANKEPPKPDPKKHRGNGHGTASVEMTLRLKIGNKTHVLTMKEAKGVYQSLNGHGTASVEMTLRLKVGNKTHVLTMKEAKGIYQSLDSFFANM